MAFMEKFFIGKKAVGPGNPAFIIAEIGSNFGGSIEKAKKLIGAAAEAGADAAKFQTFRAERLVTAASGKPAYQAVRKNGTETYQRSLKKFEISKEGHLELKKCCEKNGIIFLSTPHGGEESVELLESLGLSAYKIGSGDLTNIPFLEFVAGKKKPVLLSTGMATISEIRDAVSAIKARGNSKVLLFQCTSSYPCPVENSNLLAMETLRKEFGTLVGFSDHTTAVSVSVAAVALGASAIERHFTLNRKDPGPDHRASLEPHEFAQMVSYIREVERALGSGKKKPCASELELAKIARKSVVAAVDIKAGERISAGELEVKRPGTGIPPKDIAKVIGRKAKRGIKRDSLISFKDLV